MTEIQKLQAEVAELRAVVAGLNAMLSCLPGVKELDIELLKRRAFEEGRLAYQFRPTKNLMSQTEYQERANYAAQQPRMIAYRSE